MKRTIISLFVALLATVTVQAQQIAVVSGDGTTNIYQTLDDAISGATAGSTIYLPGGGFQIADETKITKQVTIIGIGHKANSENADGNTVISGNINYAEGSDDSSIMGCYISGDVVIGVGGDTGTTVNNILIKYCNLHGIQVKSKTCSGTIVNQNYIRSESNFALSQVTFNNNICGAITNIEGGIITNNIVANRNSSSGGIYRAPLLKVNNSSISNNVFFDKNPYDGGFSASSGGNAATNNMGPDNWGDNPINIGSEAWNNIFVNYNDGKITPASDFHFTDGYKQYSNIGIYGGTGFSDKGMAPLPYIVAKDIPEQTDAEGKLNIKIRVKASE